MGYERTGEQKQVTCLGTQYYTVGFDIKDSRRDYTKELHVHVRSKSLLMRTKQGTKLHTTQLGIIRLYMNFVCTSSYWDILLCL